ncbi:MAG: hypothetical protein CVU50_09165 [Candidatus Cloacimonetes bacterium HGW-Cloacimonetes-3]|jgi:hypothetical protein|nr:MAG: hypothetical protein CVU50_09165 [Candidatus Cloacimonetes bacterium HGW-Cloacimonetes-3]
MRNLLLVLILSAILLPTMLNGQELKISGEMWGRWTMDNAMYKNAAGTYESKLAKNNLSLERGYIGLESKFSESTKARFTIDLFSTDATHEWPSTYSDAVQPIDSVSAYTQASIDGAGLKIKYAYVDFANLIPIPEQTLSIGLQKVYFGTIYDWNYSLIGKAPTDEYKVANSADYGVTFNGFIPSGYGEYAIGVYNGEGYKKVGKSLKDNTELAFLANLRLTPIPGVTLGGSYMMNTVERDTKLSGDAANKKYEKQSLMDGIARLAYGPADLWIEYITKGVELPNDKLIDAGDKDYTSKGMMIMPIISLAEYLPVDLQVIGRYDMWDDSDKPIKVGSEIKHPEMKLNAITLGVNYNIMHDISNVPQMQIQLNYTDKKYSADEVYYADYAKGYKDSSQIMMQLKWRFSNTIN